MNGPKLNDENARGSKEEEEKRRKGRKRRKRRKEEEEEKDLTRERKGKRKGIQNQGGKSAGRLAMQSPEGQCKCIAHLHYF